MRITSFLLKTVEKVLDNNYIKVQIKKKNIFMRDKMCIKQVNLQMMDKSALQPFQIFQIKKEQKQLLGGKYKK